MRMKNLMTRAKKLLRVKRSRRTQLALVTVATVAAVIVVVGSVSTLASLRAAATASAMSTQRLAENCRAQAELAAPAATYATAASARPAANASPAAASSITLTGCLERHGDDFRLKDAAGVDAPKTRSWKSGFLKKGTPAIDLVDAGNHLKLKDHVGERVSVTGVLVEREMQARTLKNVASSCSD